MAYEEAIKKSKEFADREIARVYITIALFSEWQKETGGTAEDYLDYMDKTYAKRILTEAREVEA